MENLFLIGLLGVIALVIVGYGILNNKRMLEFARKNIESGYGKASKREYKDGEFAHIAGYHNNHKPDFEIDDITWNDLDMDSIYKSMDYCQSSAGDEYLYHMLRSPKLSGDVPEDMEQLIRYYMDNPDKRLYLQMALFRCGRTGKYSIYDYLNNLDNIKGENFNKDVWLLLLYAVAVFVMFVNFGLGVTAFVILLIYGGITYFATKKRIEPYIMSFAYVFRVINGAKIICAVNDEALSGKQSQMKNLTSRLASFTRFSSIVMTPNSGSIIDVILDYIRIFFHLDIIKFFQMRNQISKHWDDIDSILTIIGQIDAYVAIASYRTYLSEYCIPDISSEARDINAVNIYHPLLSNPVKNDIEFNRGIILTGSNASGKSTMLKTITVAAILAQSINTVPADSYKAPAYRIYTSLALSDDILAGESYYMTEIKTLKRIIDNSKMSTPILACVDEVLRGTNTIERISASYAILTNLSKINGIILAATHDLELAELLKDNYDNYHFEEKIEGNDILFEYKMLKGMATSRNAIKLLEIVGYDNAITEAAGNIAKNFELTGKYSL